MRVKKRSQATQSRGYPSQAAWPWREGETDFLEAACPFPGLGAKHGFTSSAIRAPHVPNFSKISLSGAGGFLTLWASQGTPIPFTDPAPGTTTRIISSRRTLCQGKFEKNPPPGALKGPHWAHPVPPQRGPSWPCKSTFHPPFSFRLYAIGTILLALPPIFLATPFFLLYKSE